MAKVTGFTAERMLAIENSTIVSGQTTPQGRLLLNTRAGAQVDAGPLPVSTVPGPKGDTGLQGDSSLPAGSISLWTGDADPPNWLICDGRAISRTLYPSLFAAIGTKYGIGDGSTTFNIPNLSGKAPVGKDVAQTEFSVLGKIGGEKLHVLTSAEMPAHTHTQNAHTHTQNSHDHTGVVHTHVQNSHGHTATSATAGSHSHNPTVGTGFQSYVSGAATRHQIAAGSSYYAITSGSLSNIDDIGYSGSTDTAPAHSHTITPASTTATNQNTTPDVNATTATNNNTTATNNNTGGDGGHNNLQPYLVVNFIIKTTNGDTVGDSQLTQRVSTLETGGVATTYVNDLIKGVELGGGVDLNTITRAGTYTQEQNADATSGTNYPVALAGWLEVRSSANNGGSGVMIWQTYTPYGTNGTSFYKRAYYNGTWYAWQKFVAETDTGYVSTGLSFTPVATSWAISSYSLRKINHRVKGSVSVLYSGATITADSQANIGDINAIFTLPTGWRSAELSLLIPAWQNGVKQWVARTANDGTVDLVAGTFPAETLTSGTYLAFYLDHLAD